MKILLWILFAVSFLHPTTSHISLDQLDFLGIGKLFRTGRNILVGDPKYTQERYMPFDPNQSDRLTGAFQRTYGFRGENLVHLIGAGFPIEELKKYNVIS